ncbi:ras and Rab interactor 3-like [Gastrophryne carolinensis]
MKLDLPQNNKGGQQFCAIQVTSENGALCIINPLFLHEHGDKWLTRHSKSEPKEKPCGFGQDHVEIQLEPSAEDVNVDQPGGTEASSSNSETLSAMDSEDKPISECCESGEISDSHPRNSKLYRKSVIRMHIEPTRECKVESDKTQISASGFSHRNEPMLSQKHKLLPHRASWMEEYQALGASLKKAHSDTSLNSSDSFLLPPLPELDSVSVSSVEEDGECSTLRKKKNHSHGLGDMVRHSILAVSTALTGLVSQEKHLANRIQQLAEDSSSYLGGIVQTFICQLQKGCVPYLSTIEMLQAIRQLLTNLKSHLLKSSDILEIMENQEMEEIKIASIIEKSLFKCVLKPLQRTIYSQLLNLHKKDGSMEKLLDNQKKMKKWSLGEETLHTRLPTPATMEKIHQKFILMHEAYSPEKKIHFLLKVCKHIYESMEASSGKKEAFGADDFLPVLIHVLLDCDLTAVQLDVEYMMELVDPYQLQGEGGYYLTTLFGALYHISTFNTITRQLSLEAQNSIRQWQRRRTIHHKHSFQIETNMSQKMSEKYASVLALDGP